MLHGVAHICICVYSFDATCSYTGRNFYYGIREHAMGSILNGISYFGLHRCSGSTFLVFADYMRAPMRVAALSELPVNYILTHDSIGVGEVTKETMELCLDGHHLN